MKDTFIPPMPLSGITSKIILDENKIKSLENRLMGPNNEGKAPSECQPLNNSDLENIKTKIILNGPLAPKEIKENINTINENNKNKNNNILKNNIEKLKIENDDLNKNNKELKEQLEQEKLKEKITKPIKTENTGLNGLSALRRVQTLSRKQTIKAANIEKDKLLLIRVTIK